MERREIEGAEEPAALAGGWLSWPGRDRAAALAGRAARLSLFLTRFLAIQLLVQGLGFAAGFVIIRALGKADYALYTLTASGVAALVTLANSGILGAALAFGGAVWQDPARLGPVIATALRSKRRAFLIMGVPTLAVLGWLLLRNGAGIGEAAALLATAWIAADWQLSGFIEGVALRLHGRVAAVQRLDLVPSLLRLALVGALFFLPDAWLATAIAAAAAGAGLLMARRGAAPLIDRAAPPDPGLARQFAKIMRGQWPNELYLIFQGQTAVLLLGVFGGPAAVADVGALGRIAVVYSVYATAMQTLVLPRFARVQEAGERRRLYAGIMALFALAAGLPVIAAALAPRPILWLLGPEYRGLSHALMLVMLNGAIAALGNAAWWLNTARAWMLPAWVNIPAGLGSQLLFMALIGVSTVTEVLWVGILSGVVVVAVNMIATAVFDRRHPRAAP
jgi:hypothetical protein